MDSIFDYLTLISGALVIVLILLQTRGASLGAGFGGDGGAEGGTVRRGSERTVHHITIGLVAFFALSLMIGFLV